MPSSTSRPVRFLGAASCAAALALASACGSGSSAPADPPAAASAAPSADPHAGMAGHEGMAGMDGMDGMAHGAGGVQLYAVQTGPLGTIVTDGVGRLVYGSSQDANDPPASRCTGACAQQWMPLVVPAGQEPELLGVQAEAVGRVTRDDGSSQLTLAGWPLYVNMDDDGGLYTPAAGAHGAWFAVTPQGEHVPV